MRRNSAASFELFIDGSLAGSSTTNPGTDATTTKKAIGNWDQTEGVADVPFLGTISDLVVVHGTALTTTEAAAILDSRTFPSGVTAAVDFPTDGTDSGDVALVEAAG